MNLLLSILISIAEVALYCYMRDYNEEEWTPCFIIGAWVIGILFAPLSFVFSTAMLFCLKKTVWTQRDAS